MLSGAESNKRKNEQYYQCLCESMTGPSHHFKKIIDMDVRRTDEANKDPKHAEMLTKVLLNFSK